jgi:hypothetical protein
MKGETGMSFIRQSLAMMMEMMMCMVMYGMRMFSRVLIRNGFPVQSC